MSTLKIFSNIRMLWTLLEEVAHRGLRVHAVLAHPVAHRARVGSRCTRSVNLEIHTLCWRKTSLKLFPFLRRGRLEVDKVDALGVVPGLRDLAKTMNSTCNTDSMSGSLASRPKRGSSLPQRFRGFQDTCVGRGGNLEQETLGDITFQNFEFDEVKMCLY